MRAVIYARYSSDLQRDASVEDQVRLCRELIEREGWTTDATYADRGQSGASTLRSGYQKLLEDARAGRFDVVVAEALDRLSRDQEDVAGLYKRLQFAGVQLVTISEGRINELHVGLKGTMNALFLKDLAAKTHRGLRGRVEQGKSGGGNAYGYEVVLEHDVHGEPIRGGRRIKPDEASIIHDIFEAFATGRSPRAIAKDLNSRNIPGPGGRAWSDTTIRGHATRRTGLLHNDLYVGRLVWNKQHYVKDPATGKRLARLNPETAWVIQSVPELRIVSDELWARVEVRLDAIRQSPMVTKSRATRFWEGRRAKHILTGLARCGCCGGTLAAAGKDYLACGSARRKGSCSNTRSIRRSGLEAIILRALQHNLMQPELVQEFIAAYQVEANRQFRQADEGLADRRRELQKVSAQLDQVIEAITNGLRSAGLQAKLDTLESRKAALEAEMIAAPASILRLHPNLAMLYRRKVEQLQEALTDPATQTEALEIVRGLIEEVVLRPIDGGFEVELIGEIAHMIELASSPANKKAAPYGAAVSADAVLFQRSVKVVAGTCNCLELPLDARHFVSEQAAPGSSAGVQRSSTNSIRRVGALFSCARVCSNQRWGPRRSCSGLTTA